MKLKTIHDVKNLKGLGVLVRVDLNVPVHQGKVLDTTRMDRIVPTVDFLVQAGARVILLSHFGRPKGQVVPNLSLRQILPALKNALGHPVQFVPDCVGEEALKVAQSLEPGSILLLENVRFHEGEEKNDLQFAEQLAGLGALYVNDGFAVSHRAHSSTQGITNFLPSVAGLLMAAEIEALSKTLTHPAPPVVAFLSGSKVSTKLSILNNLVLKVDSLVLAGGIATTFLYAKGIPVGKSLCEKNQIKEAQGILKSAEKNNCRIILPQDVMVVPEIKEGALPTCVPVDQIPEDQTAVDIGPKTIKALSEILKKAKTLVWNGPLGVFEIPPFDQGTREVAKTVATQTQSGSLFSVAGGGETVAALTQMGLAKDLSYVSTAGGAFLEWVEGKTLPGIAALVS